MARIVPFNEAAMAPALQALADGYCVAIPTETVYGLAADATNGLAVARIFEMKGRPRFNPLICHVADAAMAARYGEMDETAHRLAARFWPGPLTLVVPALPESGISELAMAGLGTVGLRCPDSPARALIAAFGKPIAAPSANRSGRISPTTAEHVAGEFADAGLLVLDGGPCREGIESTIVKVEPRRLVLLRPGSISKEALEAETGLPVVAASGRAIEAPGMLASHYAPDAALRTNVTDCPPGAALLAFGDGAGRNRKSASAMLNLSASGDLREAAANLYAMLKQLDCGHPSLIAVEPVPMEGLGIAINDRLARAAAPREAA
ncbi:MAG: L-threonylcarbamoyladenylate synthase [Nitratireductor sp.]|nr:L-threonylcarbamoyladenylate synthase [Nitratireductor sp.]